MSGATDEIVHIRQSVMQELARVAEKDGQTVDQFVDIAVNEKLAALHGLEALRERAAHGNPDTLRSILERSQGNDPPRDGDELLEI